MVNLVFYAIKVSILQSILGPWFVPILIFSISPEYKNPDFYCWMILWKLHLKGTKTKKMDPLGIESVVVGLSHWGGGDRERPTKPWYDESPRELLDSLRIRYSDRLEFTASLSIPPSPLFSFLAFMSSIVRYNTLLLQNLVICSLHRES